MKDGLCVMLLEAKEREYAGRGQHFTISTEWDCARFKPPVREPAIRDRSDKQTHIVIRHYK